MQKNLDVNLKEIKTKSMETDIKVTKLYNDQVLLEEKMGDLGTLTGRIEGELCTQTSKLELIEEKCGDRVSQVEYEFAADIETVKNNIEEQMAYERQIQMQLENRFANFTEEIEVENIKMKENLKELQNDLENLKI